MRDSNVRERCLRARTAFLIGNMTSFKKYAEEARLHMIEKGYVNAEPLFKWIEREWLEKGIAEGVIVHNDTGYHPKGSYAEVEKQVGVRGRTPILEKRTELDMSGYFDFLRRYEQFIKHKEQMEELTEEDIRGLFNNTK